MQNSFSAGTASYLLFPMKLELRRRISLDYSLATARVSVLCLSHSSFTWHLYSSKFTILTQEKCSLVAMSSLWAQSALESRCHSCHRFQRLRQPHAKSLRLSKSHQRSTPNSREQSKSIMAGQSLVTCRLDTRADVATCLKTSISKWSPISPQLSQVRQAQVRAQSHLCS